MSSEMSSGIEEYANEISVLSQLEKGVVGHCQEVYREKGLEVPQFAQMTEPLIPDLELKWNPEKREPYEEDRRSEANKKRDAKLPLIKLWLSNPLVRPEGMNDDDEYRSFMRYASHFFLKEGKMYRKTLEDGLAHKLVVDKVHRMYMMRATHDGLGHRGIFATRTQLAQRYWWPGMEEDVEWYIHSCHLCQTRQSTLLRIPPVVTHTPSLFHTVHVDVMVMGEQSNKCGLVVNARDSLAGWVEGRPLVRDTAQALGMFLFEDIICRWGCPQKFVTDNAPQFIAAVEWLKEKYGIPNIQVSPYNSQGNGKIENGHFMMRQALYKATGGNPSKWFWFFHLVLWSDRITIRKGLGCSPYFMVTGAHPILPLDVEEATWLVELPGRVLTDSELIGYRAQALAKHVQHVLAMRARVDHNKRVSVRKYERVHENTIKNYDFAPGSLVLVRHTGVEKSLNAKMQPRYMGPMIVIRRTLGGAYLVAEMNGAMFQDRIAAFRVIPYDARHSIPIPANIHKLIDISKETLNELVNDKTSENKSNRKTKKYKGKDLMFDKVRLRVTPEDFEQPETSESELGSEDEEEPFSLDGEPEEQGPRRSKRKGKAVARRTT